MAALKHWSGFRAKQDSTPPHPPSAPYAEYCTGLNCWTVAKEKMPPPPSFSQTGSRVIQGFSLPFYTVYFDFLLSFSFFFFCHTQLPMWCNSAQFLTAIQQPSEVVQPVEQCALFLVVSYFGTSRVIGRLAHFLEWGVRLLSSLHTGQHTFLHVSAKTHLLLTLATWA